MSLTRGARLGSSAAVGPLGAGGMGEVYEARDTRLNGTVAINVLPERLASDPHLERRVEREAKTISSPHICTPHDIGKQDTIDLLVMGHLEGETLAGRLNQGGPPCW